MHSIHSILLVAAVGDDVPLRRARVLRRARAALCLPTGRLAGWRMEDAFPTRAPNDGYRIPNARYRNRSARTGPLTQGLSSGATTGARLGAGAAASSARIEVEDACRWPITNGEADNWWESSMGRRWADSRAEGASQSAWCGANRTGPQIEAHELSSE